MKVSLVEGSPVGGPLDAVEPIRAGQSGVELK